MGADKQLIISQTGYPGTNDTWRIVQGAINTLFEAVARVAGDKTILAGLTVSSNTPLTYTAGFVAYNGEVLPFESGAHQANVTIIETIATAEYDVDTNGDGVNDILPVSKVRYMKFGSDGVATFPFTDLYRLDTLKALSQFELPAGIVIDSQYIRLTQAMIDKLAGIATGAQVNIKPNWDAPENTAAGILNKPVNLIPVLVENTVYIGDVTGSPANMNLPISFANINTSDYMVVGNMVSQSAAWNNDSGVIWLTREHTATGFKLILSEVYGNVQSLRFYYKIIPLDII